jgi:transcriptional regulator with XRE-family HTH domain
MDDIYIKIKQLRFEQGMTLKELSQKTNLSISFLSQIERGTSSLAITSLKKIADAFGVKMIHFFKEETNINYVKKKEDQKPFKIESSDSTFIRLSSNFPERKMEPFIVKLKPKQKDAELVRHPGEEFFYCMKGALIVRVEEQEYHLYEGETIHFPSTVPHMWENPLNQETVLLSITTPAIF